MVLPVKVQIPEFCLVIVCADDPAESSAFLQQHFRADEHVDLGAEEWPRLAADRLSRRELVAIDATGATTQRQIDLVRLAKTFYAQPLAFVVCRAGSPSALRTVRNLESVGFKPTQLVHTGEQEQLTIERLPLQIDYRHELGPFDIIGDVHGCADELIELMERLGYSVRFKGLGEDRRAEVTCPPGRRMIFLGDFVDRGPRSPEVLRIAMAMVSRGQALAVPGNHDVKFLKWLRGANVRLTHGLDRTVAQFERESADFRDEVRRFLLDLPTYLWLEGGRLVATHGGILEEMIGRDTPAVREFCIYGDTDGETDETGLVIRYHWAAHYRGETTIVYGHTPVPEADWVNNTLCIDTGCVFGGKLTAVRWPELEIVSVPAREMYTKPGRPFGHPPVRPSPARQQHLA